MEHISQMKITVSDHPEFSHIGSRGDWQRCVQQFAANYSAQHSASNGVSLQWQGVSSHIPHPCI